MDMETQEQTQPASAQDTSKFKDRILYCERCGISFLYPIEEQQATDNRSMPLLCPGCRKLLPDNERERGVVKWFNRRRHYGFIIRAHAEEIFVHGSNVEGRRNLQPGDLVEFTVEENEKGLIAASVRFLQHDNDPAQKRNEDTVA